MHAHTARARGARQSIYPGLRVVSELNRPKFVKHLGVTGESHKSLLPEWLYMFEMVYAAGDVVNSSFLEALLCQAFFNSSIISVVEALLDHTEVGGETEGFEDVISPVGNSKNYRVSGRDRRSRLMLGKRMLGTETPAAAKYRARRSQSSVKTPAAGGGRTGLTRGHLFQVDLPEGFAVRSRGPSHTVRPRAYLTVVALPVPLLVFTGPHLHGAVRLPCARVRHRSHGAASVQRNPGGGVVLRPHQPCAANEAERGGPGVCGGRATAARRRLKPLARRSESNY